MSETSLLLPGLLPVTVTELLTLPEFTVFSVIRKLALKVDVSPAIIEP